MQKSDALCINADTLHFLLCGFTPLGHIFHLTIHIDVMPYILCRERKRKNYRKNKERESEEKSAISAQSSFSERIDCDSVQEQGSDLAIRKVHMVTGGLFTGDTNVEDKCQTLSCSLCPSPPFGGWCN